MGKHHSILIAQATELFQQIRRGAVGKYMRKLNLKKQIVSALYSVATLHS